MCELPEELPNNLKIVILRKSQNLLETSPAPTLTFINKTAVKIYAKTDMKVFWPSPIYLVSLLHILSGIVDKTYLYLRKRA